MTKATVYYDGRVIWEVRDESGVKRSMTLSLLATGHLQIKLHDQCGILSVR